MPFQNFEERYDTYEGVGVIQLPVRRTVGSFGGLEVAWQASPREADTSDFTPGTGYVTFLDGEVEAFVELEIVDDNLPENLQVFGSKTPKNGLVLFAVFFIQKKSNW